MLKYPISLIQIKKMSKLSIYNITPANAACMHLSNWDIILTLAYFRQHAPVPVKVDEICTMF